MVNVLLVIHHTSGLVATHSKYILILHSYLCQQNTFDMKFTTKIIFSFILVLFSIQVEGQELIHQKGRSITINAGLSFNGIKDNRFSAINYKSMTPTYGLVFRKWTNNTRQEFDLRFSMHTQVDQSRLLSLKFMRPYFSYSLQKRVKDTWVGGFINHNTLLTYPSSRTGHFGNNPISYTIANSIGPKVTWSNGFNFPNDQKINITSSLETALLSYVIRPAFGHPYPERFLESGDFTPTRKGMAGALLKSGKVMTVNKFQSIRLVFGLSYFLNDNVGIGLNVNLDYQRTNDVNTSSLMTKDLIFSLSYQY